jgi:hypothetical protein
MGASHTTEGIGAMFYLTQAYIQQADREREVATDLRNRQILRVVSQTTTPIDPPAPSTRIPRRAPARARAVSR